MYLRIAKNCRVLFCIRWRKLSIILIVTIVPVQNFLDRIEFVTIGGLVKGIALDDVMLGVSALRNQYLANIFYRL